MTDLVLNKRRIDHLLWSQKDRIDKNSLLSKMCSQSFPLSWSIKSPCCFELVLATVLQTLKVKLCSWNRCCLWPLLAHQDIFCNKPRRLLSSLYVHLIQCAKLLSKHLQTNFKHLLGMELETDVIFLGFLSVNNDLFIYLFIYAFAVSVGCEIR